MVEYKKYNIRSFTWVQLDSNGNAKYKNMESHFLKSMCNTLKRMRHPCLWTSKNFAPINMMKRVDSCKRTLSSSSLVRRTMSVQIKFNFHTNAEARRICVFLYVCILPISRLIQNVNKNRCNNVSFIHKLKLLLKQLFQLA